jgi:hypothetical protein
MTRPALLLALLVPFALHAQAGRVERLKRGDTTIVRTTGNGVWGAPRDAIEVKRVGGESPALTFGYIVALVATPAGGVALFDGKGVEGEALRLLDASGKLVRTIGRNGGGPGEHGGCGANCIAVGKDGTIAMLDYANRRLDVYDRNGAPLPAIPAHSDGGPTRQILAGPNRSFYVSVDVIRSPNREEGLAERLSRSGFAQLAADGRILDTIAPPHFAPNSGQELGIDTKQWLVLPDGLLAWGSTDRLAILLRQPKGATSPLMIEQPTLPVKYVPRERQEILDVLAWARKQYGAAYEPPDPKLVKPAWASMVEDNDGRIWIQRRVGGIKRASEPPSKDAQVGSEDGHPIAPRPKVTYAEPPVFAGFRTDGTYLGEVRFPLGASHITFTGDYAWAVVTNDDGEEFLVKYRITPTT